MPTKALLPLALAAALSPAPAAAQPSLETVISAFRADAETGDALVDLRFLNGGDTPQTVALPDRIEAQLQDGTPDTGPKRSVWLRRTADTPSYATAAPGGFVRARYRLAGETGGAGRAIRLAIPAWSTPTIALSAPPIPLAPPAARAPAPTLAQAASSGSSPALSPAASGPRTPDLPAPPPGDPRHGNAFLGNLSAYEPIYAVYGPGTNSDARIQISFKYQLFGSRAGSGGPAAWRDGLHFAYTQRMFWDLGADSSPFRNIDYRPELLYITPSATLDNRITLSGQLALRHESNGRDGAQSRSVNSLTIAPMAALPLAGGTRLTVAPRLSFTIGDKTDNPDIVRYRGNGGLFLEIGRDDGLRLSTTSRYNFASGKGALDAHLSYPLTRLLGGGPDVYLFAQSFVGYGENLLDYNRRDTRFRLGVALVR